MEQLLSKSFGKDVGQLIGTCYMLDLNSLILADVASEKVVLQIDVLGSCCHLWCINYLITAHVVLKDSGLNNGIGELNTQHSCNFLDQSTQWDQFSHSG